ncbi:hypothetical protein [Alkalilimnicola sp. S0819]|uniref:hypothetical protein n=1 Tax=Alkalilimnicola sp. S0819 TaxID=2613922 RepID=UPI001261C50E|nr:hypothetical protein [Alkalilimnicola sp. S0819]KAB7627269.1 hypothetical protein F3N43_04975 [Alkalilimnicola sp. S0819]MPQ15982.1 hypothetical protein [Alkalilimnicola sp. S0819]
MRQITDERGCRWDAQVLFASYGIYYIIFAAEGAGPVRKAPLGADTQLEAAQRLADLSEEALREKLAESVGLEESGPFGI